MVRLIVNADDFGYFDSVSAGILDAIEYGTVTATGVMANGAAFDRWAAALLRHPEVDAGVHLNLTHGPALTRELPARLLSASGTLPSRNRLIYELMRGRVPLAAIRAEWRAQIEKCLAAGLTVRFLNSHEHVHMLPALLPVLADLAREFDVPYIRCSSAEFSFSHGLAALLRSLLMKGLSLLQAAPAGAPRLLGLVPSGRLNMAYLHRALPRLQSGAVYELMCHPGRADAAATTSRKLRRYHDWSGELACLTGRDFRAALRQYSIETIRFRDLPQAGSA